jgi:ABC-2 type transport system ATP-binding protein
MTINGFDGLRPEMVLLLVPLIVLELGLMVLAIVDLLRDDRRVRGGSKGVWAVVIVFVSMFGPILYFLVGREEGPVEPDAPGPGAMPGWGSPHDPPLVRPSARNESQATAVMAAGGVTTPSAPTGLPEQAVLLGTTPDGDTSMPATTGAATPATTGAATPATTGAATPPGALTRPLRADAPPAIDISGLTKRYPAGVLALDGLTMTVPEGSVFGLLGPNGAGKTTTLRLLAGLTRATAGRATLAGVPVSSEAVEVRRRLGYLEQDPRAYTWMTGRAQLRMLGRLHGLDGPALERSISDALDRVDLTSAADRRTGSYSGGMRQRLGIAGALVHRPPVAILDEPVSSLDPEGRRDVLNLIAALRGQTTVLFSTHVLADVERICDRVAILHHGRLVVEGPLADLLDRYALPVYRIEAEPGQAATVGALAARLAAEDWVTGIANEHGVLTIAVSDPVRAGRELLPAIGATGLSVISVARARPTLEDVFLRLTGEGSGAAA